jgi:folate-dependent tRNA-U54 methylase TrmFO/GidA
METEKTATANEDDYVYSQVKKKDEKGTLYNPISIQLTLNHLRGDGQ